jgi:thiosulfate/3-mercaptopyruvate sulfurtransferase
MEKVKISVLAFLLMILFTGALYSQSTAEPWTSKDLMDPLLLSKILTDSKIEKPYIFNIGPLANIKGAVKTGSAAEKQNLGKLREALSKIPKDKVVVIYCGCCPFRNCPNVRPAFALLQEMKFSKPKLLNLPRNLKVDWMDWGYPME